MYGKTFTAWRAEAAELWHAYTHHPFVEGLKDCTLPRDAYLRYLVQDYVFLIRFSRAWALAVTKAETIDEMRFVALAPCVMGYGEIGLRFAAAQNGAQKNAPYADWIDTYAGQGNQQVCHEVGALLDAAIARRVGPSPQQTPRWAALSQRFATAVRLEVGFCDMGLSG